MLNNGLSWNRDGQNHINNVFADQFRYWDNNRKNVCEHEGINEHWLYSQYFMAYMIGKPKTVLLPGRPFLHLIDLKFKQFSP